MHCKSVRAWCMCFLLHIFFNPLPSFFPYSFNSEVGILCVPLVRVMQTDELDKKKTGSIALPIHDDVTAESSRSASTHYFDSRETSYEQERGRVRHYLHCAKPYLLGFSVRVAGLIVLLAVLIGLGLGLRYTEGMPRPEDDSNLVFDWRVDPASYLTPFNQSFQYNVLLDGHAHSTYSDGRMNVRQLLEWHIG